MNKPLDDVLESIYLSISETDFNNTGSLCRENNFTDLIFNLIGNLLDEDKFEEVDYILKTVDFNKLEVYSIHNFMSIMHPYDRSKILKFLFMSTNSLNRSFIEIYDIEVIRNCFLYLGIDTKSNQIIEFVIFGARNDLREFCRHLRSLKGQIGFNNLNYDSQVCQFILNNKIIWENATTDEITEDDEIPDW